MIACCSEIQGYIRIVSSGMVEGATFTRRLSMRHDTRRVDARSRQEFFLPPSLMRRHWIWLVPS
jgi:hypothetical protein